MCFGWFYHYKKCSQEGLASTSRYKEFQQEANNFYVTSLKHHKSFISALKAEVLESLTFLYSSRQQRLSLEEIELLIQQFLQVIPDEKDLGSLCQELHEFH